MTFKIRASTEPSGLPPGVTGRCIAGQFRETRKSAIRDDAGAGADTPSEATGAFTFAVSNCAAGRVLRNCSVDEAGLRATAGVFAGGCAGFVDDDRLEQRKLRLETIPNPFGNVLGRWV